MKRLTFIIASGMIVILLCSSSYSQSRNYLSLSAAFFDILQQSDPAFETRIEFRLGKLDLFANPFSGVMYNSSGAAHLFVGFYKDLRLLDNLIFTPSFAPGLYVKNKSKDLKFVLEFRSQIEFAYLFDNGARIALGFYHMSNASLGNENPGVESLSISYIFPFL